VDAPAIEDVEAAVYHVLTDAPERDGALAWDKTTPIPVIRRVGGQEALALSTASRLRAAPWRAAILSPGT
jgi:hypothetical protein